MASFSQTIEFSELTHDFGKVTFKGDTLSTKFVFSNKGNSMLEIFNVKESCGCMVTDFPKSISPGSIGYITVKYFNVNPGFINKSITVTTNDVNNSTIVLRIKGETYKSE